MHVIRRSSSVASAWLVAVLCTLSGAAQAQMEVPNEGLAVGDWTFFPALEVRVRGEVRHHPIDVGGDQYERTGVQADAFRSAAPNIRGRAPAVTDVVWLSERARLGLRVEWQLLTAKVVLQDARVLGTMPTSYGAANSDFSGELAPYEMYLDVRDKPDSPMLEFRLGRQRVKWGDGRLIGDNDWLPRAGAMDAARLQWHMGDVHVEALAALLALPRDLPPPQKSAPAIGDLVDAGGVGGAQLYGLRADWRLAPLFRTELAALARIARAPLPAQLMPADSYTVDARVYGEARGFRYAAEGALQLGRVSSYGTNRDIMAFAVAAHADWQTALPWDMRFRLEGSYASGDDSNGEGASLRRFDPLLPNVHDAHGQMDLYSWSNTIEGAGSWFVTPNQEVTAGMRYALVGLAEPNDRLSTGALLAVGAAPDNDSRLLGHEIDIRIDYAPWRSLQLGAGYGLMIWGEGGKAILQRAGRGGAAISQHAYLQAELRVP